ncbi:MAG: SH3 domain-containing protein [Caldilineaceae bacterium]|nr:SH3 domain-containing protein [Caldilineaceae bacterium]
MSHAKLTFPATFTHKMGWRQWLLLLALVALASGLWWAQQSGTLAQWLERLPVTTLTRDDSATVTNSMPMGLPPTTMDNPSAAEAVTLAANAAVANDEPETATTAETPMLAASQEGTAPTLRPLTTVAGLAGVQLWNDAGALLTTLEIGTKVPATARTADGEWILVTTASGYAWAQANQVVAFDLTDLPVTPLSTPVLSAVPVASTDLPNPEATPSDETALPTTSLATSATATLAGSVVTSGANLNVRSGAGTDYPLVGKVANGATVTIVGRSELGDWLAIQLGSDPTELGWVATSYVQLDQELTGLPVVAQNVVAEGTPS